jgi:hypothetical protein
MSRSSLSPAHRSLRLPRTTAETVIGRRDCTDFHMRNVPCRRRARMSRTDEHPRRAVADWRPERRERAHRGVCRGSKDIFETALRREATAQLALRLN